MLTLVEICAEQRIDAFNNIKTSHSLDNVNYFIYIWNDNHFEKCSITIRLILKHSITEDSKENW